MNKEVKTKLFNELPDLIISEEANYPSFGECKSCIKKQNSQYVISKNDEKKNSNVVDLFTFESTN